MQYKNKPDLYNALLKYKYQSGIRGQPGILLAKILSIFIYRVARSFEKFFIKI